MPSRRCAGAAGLSHRPGERRPERRLREGERQEARDRRRRGEQDRPDALVDRGRQRLVDRGALAPLLLDHLEQDDRIVDHDADEREDTQERHEAERLAGDQQAGHDAGRRQRHGDQDH